MDCNFQITTYLENQLMTLATSYIATVEFSSKKYICTIAQTRIDQYQCGFGFRLSHLFRVRFSTLSVGFEFGDDPFSAKDFDAGCKGDG